MDAVDALRIVGHEILSYALRFYEGRLSRLIADFERWVLRNRSDEAVTPSLALDFISCTFGPHHHLTSLFRLSSEIAARATGAPPTPPETTEHSYPFDPERTYRLSSRSCLFTDLHDCTRLLERIRSLPRGAAPLDDANVGDRSCYMVLMVGANVAHYWIDPGVEGILSLFTVPRSAREVGGLLREITCGASAEDSFFKELVEIGALVPATSGQGLVGRAS